MSTAALTVRSAARGRHARRAARWAADRRDAPSGAATSAGQPISHATRCATPLPRRLRAAAARRETPRRRRAGRERNRGAAAFVSPRRRRRATPGGLMRARLAAAILGTTLAVSSVSAQDPRTSSSLERPFPANGRVTMDLVAGDYHITGGP